MPANGEHRSDVWQTRLGSRTFRRGCEGATRLATLANRPHAMAHVRFLLHWRRRWFARKSPRCEMGSAVSTKNGDGSALAAQAGIDWPDHPSVEGVVQPGTQLPEVGVRQAIGVPAEVPDDTIVDERTVQGL